MAIQYDFGFSIRPSLRLSEIEEILRKYRIINPIPSRANLIELIEDGRLEGKMTTYGYIVYEDSFKLWVKSFQPEEIAA